VTFHSGPFLVSRVGDVGWTKHQVKMSKYKKFKEPKKAIDSYWQLECGHGSRNHLRTV